MKVGIIGGSGLEDPKFLEGAKEKAVAATPYGTTSSNLICGTIKGVDVCIISRHGKGHVIGPSQVPYAANIYALRREGCKYIIATTAVGSLKDEIEPGDLVLPNQAIDSTRKRITTFYDPDGFKSEEAKKEFKFDPNTMHTPMADPFDIRLRNLFSDMCEELGYSCHRDKTVVTIEGPRFSTRGESIKFRDRADIINMSTCPEVFLAKEAGIPYQSIAISTDYDSWKDDGKSVNWDMIKETFSKSVGKVTNLILKSLEHIDEVEDYYVRKKDREYIKSKIRTIPNFPKPGVLFRDITTLFEDSDGKRKTIDAFYNRYRNHDFDLVAGIEARGFIVASALSHRLGKGLVLLRKPNKLPHKTLSESYSLEYADNTLHAHIDSIKPGQRVLLADDLLATGGTAEAGCKLIERSGGTVAGVCFIVDLPDLKGREKLSKYNIFSLVEFEGH